jgi:hypothetical protein
MLPLHSASLNNLQTLGPHLRVAYVALSSLRCALLFDVDLEVDCGVAVVALPTAGKSGRGNRSRICAMTTGAIAKAATATPSSAAERSIEVAWTSQFALELPTAWVDPVRI